LGFDLGIGNGFLSARINLVDTFLGVGLTQVGPLCDQLREVGAVFRAVLAVGQALSEDPGHRTMRGVVADGRRTVIAKQAVDEVTVLIAAGVCCSGTGRLSRGSGCATGDTGTGLHTAADDTAHRADDQHSGNQRRHTPGEEAMGGITEIHFISVHVGPLNPQAAGDIATQTGGNNLRRRQPDNRGNPQALGADALPGPR